VIETMVGVYMLALKSDSVTYSSHVVSCCLQSHNHSQCIRPRLAPYTVSPQTAVFELKGSLVMIILLPLK
jgi:hypothetical protein